MVCKQRRGYKLCSVGYTGFVWHISTTKSEDPGATLVLPSLILRELSGSCLLFHTAVRKHVYGSLSSLLGRSPDDQ